MRMTPRNHLTLAFSAAISAAISVPSAALAVTPTDIEPNQQSAVTPLLEPQDALPGFADGTSLILKPRSYYLNRDRDTNPDTAGWALGGALAYSSGWWQQVLQLNATLYTSQKLYGPSDKDGTQLFKPGPEQITTLGEANLTFRLAKDTGIRLGRQRFELPYLGSHDIRMIPNTFEAAAIGNVSASGLAYMAGYVDRIKRKNDDDFIKMSEAAGVTDGDDGLVFAGGRYAWDNTLAGIIYQRTFDVFDTAFAKFEHAIKLDGGNQLKGFIQYTDQRSHGDHLIGRFNTSLTSGKLEFSTGPATLRIGASHTDDEFGIQKPYGNPANYLSVIVEDFDRAGEDAVLVGATWNFQRVGIGDLSSFVNIVRGNTPDSGTNASADETEYDLTVDYRIKQGWAQRLWLRARVAYVDQDDDFTGANDFTDFRIIANYDYDLL